MAVVECFDRKQVTKIPTLTDCGSVKVMVTKAGKLRWLQPRLSVEGREEKTWKHLGEESSLGELL